MKQIDKREILKNTKDMPTGLINLDRGEFFNSGILPRQRRVYLMRWNPSISSFTRKDFDDYFKLYKGEESSIKDYDIVWSIWDWKEVMHRDLFVMMQVGQEKNGIVWGGFLKGMPFQFENENGEPTKSHFIDCTVMYMHRIEKTNLIPAERLMQDIPEVNWLHGHSGELLPIESAEKLGLLMVDELRKANENDDLLFDSYCQKKYVLADILTFMCPELKKRLVAMGKNNDKETDDINDLMVSIDDEDYQNWNKIEEHMHLRHLNGLLM